MKRNLIITTLLAAGTLFGNKATAQQAALAPDQNPRYHESANRYMLVADSINRLQGTTVQNTYKAYDWYTAREERRQQNRQWRNTYGGYYDYSPGWSLYSGYSSYPYYSLFGGNYGYGYGNRWGGRGGRWGVGFGYSW